MNRPADSFWSVPSDQLLQALEARSQGLSSDEARRRLARYGYNLLKPKRRPTVLLLFLVQFKSPIILILLAAAVLSFIFRAPVDAVLILAIILASGFLSFWQERGAADAVEKLLSLVHVKATVLRDGRPQDVPFEEVVPGDLVNLNAGDSIPGDCRLLEAEDLFVDEAVLTGETFPVEKSTGEVPVETPIARRSNSLFMGTHVVSGTATALVVCTGKETEFGRISERLRWRPPETEFERGIRRFGYFLLEVTLVLVLAIFSINVFLHRPVLDSFLFALALAVGLTPQLLPAIISVNLAHGAKRMAGQKVIVKRLASIENFGSMSVLCADKTGTLTEGSVRLQAALDADGSENERVLLYAYLNASYQTGFTNPIDQAITAHRSFDLEGYEKLDEIPYDFVRKRLTVLVSQNGGGLMITKGAFANVLAVCSLVCRSSGLAELETAQAGLEERFKNLSQDGYRTLGLAYKEIATRERIEKEEENALTFLGFLVFTDSPKAGINDAIHQLESLGVALKIITGDNALVASHVARQVGIATPRCLIGSQLRRMSEEALVKRVNEINLFAEVEPNQKERIIMALRKSGQVVGFMGDGINDAPALNAADVGISVDCAVDVAKETADLVLLEKDLGVLARGVEEGRRTFANTLKYVFMATSANFGNMFSMAGASVFLPFLPLLPKQILLTNLLTDFPEMTIAADRVDVEMLNQPRRWNMLFIRKFMVVFGLLSSVFDYLTFGVLLLLLKAGTKEFRTGWFVESVLSASMVVLVVRTRRPFFKSRPSKNLFLATLAVAAATLVLPLTPLGRLFGFVLPPIKFLFWLGLILVIYLVAAELVKSGVL